MAQKTIRSSGFANINPLYPNQSFYSDSYPETLITDGAELLFAFPFEDLSKKRIASVSLGLYRAWAQVNYQAQSQPVPQNVALAVNELSATFDPRTVTWSNAPHPASGLTQFDFTLVPGRSDINAYQFGQIPAGALSRVLASGVRVNVISTHEAGTVVMAFGTSNSANAPYLFISYFDADPYAENCSPNGVAVRSDREQTLSWSFAYDQTGVTGTLRQAGAKVRWRAAGAADYTYKTVTGDIRRVTFPAGTFPSGKTIEWGVQLTSDDGVTGGWTPATFEVSGAPSGLAITSVTTKPRSTITWSAEGQLAYEVVITNGVTNVYTSGAVYGRDTSHTISEYLADGTYQVFVRVRNDFGWSEWACADVTIQNSSLPQIALNAALSGGGVSLCWDGTAEFSCYQVLRDGVPVASTDGRTHTDRFGCALHGYSIRGVNSAGDYSLSQTVFVNAAPKRPQLVDVQTGARFSLGWRKNSKATHSMSLSGVSECRRFEGRQLPVYETGGFIDALHEWSFMPDGCSADAVFSLVNKLCFYADADGHGCFVFVTDVSSDPDGNLSFSAKETDHHERISFE